MGMQLPEWMRTMFLVASGDGWPEADEDQLWALAREWAALGDAIDALQVQAVEPVRATRRTDWDGPAADAFAVAGNGLGGQQLSGLGAGSRNVAGFIYRTGVNVQYMKIIVLEELLILAAQIAQLVTMAGPSFGASLAAAAGLKAFGRYLARAAVTGLNAFIASLAISEGLQLGVDAIGQTVQLALRTRRHWDRALTVDAAIVGAVGGVLGPVVHHGVGASLAMIKGGVGASLSGIVGNASHEYLTSGVSGAITGRGWSGTPWDVTAGATEGTIEALTRRRSHHGALPADPTLDIPRPWAPVDTVSATPGDRSITGPADGPVRRDAPLTGEDRSGRPPGEIGAAESVRPSADQPGGGQQPDPQPVRRLRADAAQAQPGPAHTVIAAAPQTQRVEAFEINAGGQVHRLEGPHVDPGAVSPTAAPFSAAPASGYSDQPNDSGPGAAAAPARRQPEQVQQETDPAGLDTLWGRLAGPKDIKEGEWDDKGDIRLNPLWYRLSDLPANLVLSRPNGKWQYTVGADGEIRIGAVKIETLLSDEEWAGLVVNMRGTERHSNLTVEALKSAVGTQGHPTIAAGFTDTGRTVAAPARISGELVWNPDTTRWELNDKSGRYMRPKVRPGIFTDEVRLWLTSVAARLTEHLGTEVVPVAPKYGSARPLPGEPHRPATAPEIIAGDAGRGVEADR